MILFTEKEIQNKVGEMAYKIKKIRLTIQNCQIEAHK